MEFLVTTVNAVTFNNKELQKATDCGNGTEPEPLLVSVWDNEGTEYAIPFEVLIMYQI